MSGEIEKQEAKSSLTVITIFMIVSILYLVFAVANLLVGIIYSTSNSADVYSIINALPYYLQHIAISVLLVSISIILKKKHG